MSEHQVTYANLDAPAVKAGYQCDATDAPCRCPYDLNYIQTFETHHIYKSHMMNVHDSLPSQKRRTVIETTNATKEKRRMVTTQLHEDGVFKNTHVKRQVLSDFIDLYDNFLKRLFASDEYYGSEFKNIWRNYYRVSSRDLEERTLEDLTDAIKEGDFSNTHRRGLRWLRENFSDDRY